MDFNKATDAVKTMLLYSGLLSFVLISLTELSGAWMKALHTCTPKHTSTRVILVTVAYS